MHDHAGRSKTGNQDGNYNGKRRFCPGLLAAADFPANGEIDGAGTEHEAGKPDFAAPALQEGPGANRGSGGDADFLQTRYGAFSGSRAACLDL